MRKGIYLNVLMRVEENTLKTSASTVVPPNVKPPSLTPPAAKSPNITMPPITPPHVGPSGESTAKPTAKPIDEIKQAMETLTRSIFPEHKLTVEVKRIRPEPGLTPNDKQVSVLTYIEGEQDAPLNFMEMASAELKKRLDTTFGHPLASGTKVQVHTIEENTNAVDELADEAEASETER